MAHWNLTTRRLCFVSDMRSSCSCPGCDLLHITLVMLRLRQQNMDLFRLFKGNILEMFPHFLSLYKSQVHGSRSQVFTSPPSAPSFCDIFHQALELQRDAVVRAQKSQSRKYSLICRYFENLIRCLAHCFMISHDSIWVMNGPMFVSVHE